jgi:curved DNA-binding protein CbpA
MTNNPYEILGVPKDATEEVIDRAFKAKARKAHPDSGGSAEEFIRIKQACLILLDPEKRNRFDRDGIIDENKPDNVTATALQRITMFFVQTIQATMSQSSLHLNQLDLIQGANAYFDLQIGNCHKQIYEIDSQVRQFEKVMKRLKTKRKKDVVANMLNHHVAEMKNNMLVNRREVTIYDEAKLILKDYTFEQERGVFLGNPPFGGMFR